MRHVLAIGLVSMIFACGGGGGGAPPDAFESDCGEPGDQGNELGVGRFCQTLADCSTTPDARLCSNIGDEHTWFCTRTCREDDPPGVCGSGAECTCGGGGCGCVPSECLGP